MNRWEVVTREDDDDMWGIADQVLERQWLEDGQIRWIIDTESSEDAIREVVPSVVSVQAVQADRAE